jgi:hypothetical protein
MRSRGERENQREAINICPSRKRAGIESQSVNIHEMTNEEPRHLPQMAGNALSSDDEKVETEARRSSPIIKAQQP